MFQQVTFTALSSMGIGLLFCVIGNVEARFRTGNNMEDIVLLVENGDAGSGSLPSTVQIMAMQG
jgi:hypothetical protein